MECSPYACDFLMFKNTLKQKLIRICFYCEVPASTWLCNLPGDRCFYIYTITVSNYVAHNLALNHPNTAHILPVIQFLTKHWIRCWSSDEASDVIDHVTLFSPRLGPVFLKLCDWLVPELQLQTSRHRSQRGFETIWLICTGTPAVRPPHRL